jgi:hypothetical protein
MDFESDSFDIKNKFVIERLKDKIEINSLKEIQIPASFEKKEIRLPSENYAAKLRNQIQEITEFYEKQGFNPNIFTAIYEGVLNAHQHGNNLDEKKKILLNHRLENKNLEIIIEDEGKELDEYFLPFILNLREMSYKSTFSFIDWYKFANKEKNKTNNGTGSSFMHAYMDKVRYFKSHKLKGLAVYMCKINL